MILDYVYNKAKKTFSISYINDSGLKNVLNFNVNRFKSYYPDKNGEYVNWDGRKCDVKWTGIPSKFEYKTYIKEIDKKYRDLLEKKVSPKLYTFDIETMVDEDEFPEPSQAKFPITTISICSPDCNVVILGTRKMTDEEYLSDEFDKYLNTIPFYKELNIPVPKIKYVYFDTEEDMLKYFITRIVAKVPLLSGWNSILFDWQYIQNRITYYYPNISLYDCSITRSLHKKNYSDLKGDKTLLTLPDHTLIVDMMDVIGTFDMVVMPIKESLSLDYIASNSIGAHKIKYDGSLDDLYNNDYDKYVFYNAIDSLLVQLIDKKFKTLQNIYAQALICNEKIGNCFSKIAITEAMFFNYFYDHNIKVIYEKVERGERGELVGAYVREPTPGKHKWVCCNDFSSLYPSCIRTCNLSVENYIGHGFTEDELEKYRSDPKYFVSVNGNVYKNDKDYAFKIIQTMLKGMRDSAKYLAKSLKAHVMSDIEHIMRGVKPENQEYLEEEKKKIEELGYTISCTNDIYNININDFKRVLNEEIVYLTSYEQACKLVMNSCYGGSSHIAFYWFLMPLANDITGEGRNLIHLMEKHIPEYIDSHWKSLTDVHKQLGITIRKDAPEKDLLVPIAGDTDSLYISYERLISTIDGWKEMSMERLRDIVVGLNTGFLDSHNNEFMMDYYKSRHVESCHKFELETVAYSDIRLNVKKRYAQLLIWKDGYCPDIDKLIYKSKGLETTKSSYPLEARKELEHLIRYLLENNDEEYLLQRINTEVQKLKNTFYNAPIENVCGNMKVNGYKKYIIDDNNRDRLIVGPKCPSNVKGLGNYNRLRNIYKLPGDPLYGGKMKWYKYYPLGVLKKKNTEPEVFAFQSGSYPKWADRYAPIDRGLMFQYAVIDPFNRILDAIGVGEVNIDGSIQISLF